MNLAHGQVNELLKLMQEHRDHLINIVPYVLKDSIIENFFVSYVRKGLSNSDQYEDVVRMLCAIVSCFSDEVLRDHLDYFIDRVLKNGRDCGVKFRFLDIAIKLSHSSENVNKSKVLLLIPKIVEKCIAVNKYTSYERESLYCLASCLEFYPSTCGQFKTKLESHLLEYLTYDKPGSAVEAASKCFHYLQQCGPAGTDSINHTQNWSNALIKICSTIKELLECVRDANYRFHSSREGIVLFPLAVDHTTNARLFTAEYRLHGLFTYLGSLIELKYPCPKVFKPCLLIELLEFCLNKHCTNNESVDDWHSVYIQVHTEIQLFYVFRSFVSLMKLNLMPFANTILKTLTDRLTETRSELLRYNSEYKEALYQLIACVVRTMKNNVHSQFHSKILETIYDDISPLTENITLNTNNNSSTKGSQATTETQTIYSNDRKEKICCSALDCLKVCFESMIFNIKYNSLKDIYQRLCMTLNSIQNGVRTRPYTTLTSTCKLFETIIAALEQEHPPPIPIVKNLLLRGQLSGNSTVHDMCTFGLRSIEKICQPVRPLVFSTLSSKKFMEDDENEPVISIDDDNSTIEIRTIETSPGHQSPEYSEEDKTEFVSTNVVTGEIEDEDELIDDQQDMEDDPVMPTLTCEVELCRSPPSKVSRQQQQVVTDDLTLEDMLSSFKDYTFSYDKNSKNQ